jgi:CheY-like chemotaxis protein
MDTCDLVADEGYSIVEVSSANEALLYLEASLSFQLIFTDVQMPGKLDGFE